MKKAIVFVSTLMLAGTLLVGCKKNTPKDVAREWLTDFYHMDYDDAKKLSTEETKVMINVCQGFSNSFADSIKQKAKQVTVEIKEVKIEGDKAFVKFVASNDPTAEEPPLKLVKQNDKWLVLFTKSDFKPMEEANGGAIISPDAGAAPTVTPAAQPDATMAPDTTNK